MIEKRAEKIEKDEVIELGTNSSPQNTSTTPSSSSSRETSKGEVKDLGIKVLAVIGVVATLSVFIWGGSQMLRLAPGTFSGLTAAVTNFTALFRTDETLTFFESGRNVSSGEPFTLSWEHGGKTREGSYRFAFACTDSVVFETLEGDTLVCNTPFSFSDATTELTLTPLSVENRYIDVNVSLAFIPEGGNEAAVIGNVLLTIVNTKVTDSRSSLSDDKEGEDTDTTSSTGGGNTTSVNGTGAVTPGTPKSEVITFPGSSGSSVTFSDPNGEIDLAVRILSVGVIDKSTGVYTATTSVPRNQRGGVRFEIINLGTKTAGPWSFSADLPTTPFFVFRPKESQQPLNPGERIEYTLGFDSISPTSVATVQINVDPARDLIEPNRANNEDSRSFTITEI